MPRRGGGRAGEGEGGDEGDEEGDEGEEKGEEGEASALSSPSPSSSACSASSCACSAVGGLVGLGACPFLGCCWALFALDAASGRIQGGSEEGKPLEGS